MRIAVLSGKGGTGKTFVSVNLAAVAQNVSYIDCDAEEPNGHLFFKPEETETEIVSTLLPSFDSNKCDGCRKCVQFCRFNALAFVKGKPKVFPEVCHSCGGCTLVCPQGAVTEVKRAVGTITRGLADGIPIITSKLNLGEASAVPVIKAALRATDTSAVIDSPPGSGCSVSEAISDADYCLLVAEPTAFGLHNLRMVHQLVTLLHKPFGVIVNKADGVYQPLEDFCREQHMPILARILYSKKLAELSADGKLAAKYSPELQSTVYQALGNHSSGGGVMKKLLILSGKGGTGKTTAAAAFVRFANARAFADCDVDAPNLHLVLKQQSKPETSDFYGSQKASIDPDACIGCGLCMQSCHFNAIRKTGAVYTVNEYACEGCGVCAYVCPQGAAALHDDIAGQLTVYQDDNAFVTAELKMGRGNSGKLVSEVKAKLYHTAPQTELAVIDGSPGIGCPVIASMSGVDLVLVVTEPSLSGQSDLERILKTAAVFETRAAVCVNKFDQSPEHTAQIESFCKQNNIPFLGRIPYDPMASAAVNSGKSIADIDCPASRALRQVYEGTVKLLHATDA